MGFPLSRQWLVGCQTGGREGMPEVLPRMDSRQWRMTWVAARLASGAASQR